MSLKAIIVGWPTFWHFASMKNHHLPSYKCSECLLPNNFCYCSGVKPVLHKTPIDLIIHASELGKSSSSSILAKKTLMNCKAHYYGHKDGPLEWEKYIDPQESFLLYPWPGAKVLSSDFLIQNPRAQILVLDGTWRQTIKMTHRLILKYPKIKTVTLPEMEPFFATRLRKGPNQDKYATYEAMAYCLMCIEGNKQLKDNLLFNFELFVSQGLRSRGLFFN